jgi:short-subunit dehydrogenase
MKVDAKKYGPWAVIPGGSEGIGACLATMLAENGINSVLVARKPEPLEETAVLVRKAGAQCRTLALDLTAADMLDKVRAATDDIEVGLLAYNAGAAHKTGPFLDGSIDDVLRIIRLNAVGQAVLSHHFGKKMAKRRRGGIMLFGSLAGNGGSPSVVTYAGAKAFSQIFAEGLWWELKEHNVDVLQVVVGMTMTPAMARLGLTYDKGGAVSSEHVAKLALENIQNGPVFVMPEMWEGFVGLANADRRAVTEQNAKFILGNTEGTFAAPVE